MIYEEIANKKLVEIDKKVCYTVIQIKIINL